MHLSVRLKRKPTLALLAKADRTLLPWCSPGELAAWEEVCRGDADNPPTVSGPDSDGPPTRFSSDAGAPWALTKDVLETRTSARLPRAPNDRRRDLLSKGLRARSMHAPSNRDLHGIGHREVPVGYYSTCGRRSSPADDNEHSLVRVLSRTAGHGGYKKPQKKTPWTGSSQRWGLLGSGGRLA